MQFKSSPIYVIFILLVHASLAANSECKISRNDKIFLPPLEAGFMSPGYYIYQGKSSEENLELNVQYQTAYFGLWQSLTHAAGIQTLSPEALETFSQILQNGAGILNIDGDIDTRTDLVRKIYFDSTVQFLSVHLFSEPVSRWEAHSITGLFLEASRILLNNPQSNFRKGFNILRRTDILGPKLGIENHFEFSNFIKKNYPKDFDVYNALYKRIKDISKNIRNAPCFTEDGKQISCSEDMYSEKGIWQQFIIQSNTTPESFKRSGKIWARAIPFLARFYQFFPYSNQEMIQEKLSMIIQKTKILYEQDPIEAAAFIHQALVKLHPLEDGNGRMARLMMNIVLRQANHPGIAMFSDLSYSKAVSGSSFSQFLRNRVCTTARLMEEKGDSYGQDISLLAQECMQKTKKYYIDGQQEDPDPVPECQNKFRLLLTDYEKTRDEL